MAELRSRTEDTSQRPEYLVAVGASAGGLEALIGLVGRFRSSEAALVIVQHLSPDHRSMMAELLSRHTDWPVQAVREGEPVRKANVYLIPPGKQLTVDRTALHLAPRKSLRGVSHPIDDFMISVADSWGARSVAVILSGTGTDGVEGIRAIKKAGGHVLVQDPEEAAFDGMPRSAVETGMADAVLPVSMLVSRLSAQLSARPPASSQAEHEGQEVAFPSEPVQVGGGFSEHQADEVLRLLKQLGAGDFTGYKTDALMRRVEERCRVLHYERLPDYLEVLRESESERTFLARELLIPLTHFFRDTDVFEYLYHTVITPLVREAAGERELRVWCAGVASGEEAYSVSMLFLEAAGALNVPVNLKLFATDVDGRLVDQGAEGVFSADHVMAEISEQRRTRWFEPVDDHGFRARRVIRSPIVFARHNLVSDPPFTRLDLIVCRNVLIYLRRSSQQQVLERLHYGLKPGGYLLLGQTETPGALADRFDTLTPEGEESEITGLYQLRRSAPPARFRAHTAASENRSTQGDAPQRPSPSARETAQENARLAGANSESDVVEQLQSRIQSTYLPPTLILNSRGELIHVFGDVQPIVRIGSGSASFQLERILPPSFLPVTRSLLTEALNSPDPVGVRASGDRVTSESGRVYRPEAQTLKASGESCYVAISFVLETGDRPGATDIHGDAAKSTGDKPTISEPDEWQHYAEKLQQELTEARLRERRSIEALETANEELQASNEEMTTSNEELQSTNEELQSLNEELYSVNSELQEKIRQLNQLHHDLDNMGHALGVASVFVDQDLRVRRYTEGITQFIPLTARDIGRYLGEFALDHLSETLPDDIRQCIREGQYVESSIVAGSGGAQSTSWLRIMPYFERAEQITGAVILVSNLSMVQALVQQKPVIDALPQQLLMLDDQKQLLVANRPEAGWSEEAHQLLMTSLQLSPDADLVEYNELPCERRWRASAERGNALAKAVITCLESEQESPTTVCPESGNLLIRVWSRPVRHGKRNNYLIVLQSDCSH